MANRTSAIRGDLFRLSGSDQLVLVLGEPFGEGRRELDVFVAPVMPDVSPENATTLDVMIPAGETGLRHSLGVAAWASAPIPARYLDKRAGHIEDSAVVDAVTDVPLSLVDPGVKPPPGFLGQRVADGQALDWHELVSIAMRPYWEGTAGTDPTPDHFMCASASLTVKHDSGLLRAFLDRLTSLGKPETQTGSVFTAAELERSESIVDATEGVRRLRAQDYSAYRLDFLLEVGVRPVVGRQLIVVTTDGHHFYAIAVPPVASHLEAQFTRSYRESVPRFIPSDLYHTLEHSCS